MSNIFFKKTKSYSVKDSQIYNLVVSDDNLVVRVIVPFGEINNIDDWYKSEHETCITIDTLKQSDLLFDSVRCNFGVNDFYTLTINDIKYLVLYESSISLSELKKYGLQTSDSLFDALLPILSRSYQYIGMYSDLTCVNLSSAFDRNASDEYVMQLLRRFALYESVGKVYVKNGDGNFNSEIFVLNVPANVELITNVDQISQIDDEFSLTDHIIHYDIILPDNVDADQKIQLSVKAQFDNSDYSINSYLKIVMLSGYSSKSQVKIENGSGTFEVVALNLTPGDNVEFNLVSHERVCAHCVIPVV